MAVQEHPQEELEQGDLPPAVQVERVDLRLEVAVAVLLANLDQVVQVVRPSPEELVAHPLEEVVVPLVRVVQAVHPSLEEQGAHPLEEEEANP